MAAELDRRQFLKLSLTALAATTLSLEQVGWLLDYVKEGKVATNDDFLKYIVFKINSMPEREVGRIIKIESLKNPYSFGTLVRGLSVNKHFNGGKYWAFIYDPDKVKDLSFRKEHLKGMAEQLRFAFKQ